MNQEEEENEDRIALPNMSHGVKKRWIEALRSGEYEQGDGQLCYERPDGTFEFCCLGVLADIEVDGDWVLEMEDGLQHGTWTLHGAEAYPDASDLTKLGLHQGEASTLARWNDDRVSFAEIADRIERGMSA